MAALAGDLPSLGRPDGYSFDAASALSGVLPKTGPYSNLNAEQAHLYGFTVSDSEAPEFSDYPTADAKEAMRNVGRHVPGAGAYRNANGNASFGDGAGNRELNFAEDELAAKDAVIDDFMSPKNQASRHDMIGKGLMRGLAREGQIRLQAYDSEGSTPWLLERNEVLGPINDWTTDALIDVGRTHPVLGGLGQVVRGLTFGDGTNLDAGLLALPLVGRAVGGAAKFEGLVERAAVPLGERVTIRFGDDVAIGAERSLGSTAGHPYAGTVLEGGSGTAYAGHGFRWPGAGTTVVPEGAAITLPRDGIRILDETGQYMERGDWSGLAAAAKVNPRVANDVDGMTTWLSGAEVPNYMLAAPSGGKGLTIYRNSSTVEFKTPLSDLLKPEVGCVQWAACTEFRTR